MDIQLGVTGLKLQTKCVEHASAVPLKRCFMPEELPMKVLLIDDHPLILSALQTVILSLRQGVKVSGVSSAALARSALKKDPSFDLALLDLNLGDSQGFEFLTELRSTYPALPVVVVSASDRTSDVIRAIDLGAMGFVPKRASTETLFEALHQVLSGGIYVPPMSMAPGHSSATTESADSQVSAASVAVHGAQKSTQLESLGLTTRQLDVLALMLQAKPNKLIARELGISVETVKDHVAAVLRGLNVTSRTQAVLAVGQMSQGQGGAAVRRKLEE
jgi:DNA-binding NarL/FixJ family response regulator